MSANPDSKVRDDYIARTLAKRDRMVELSEWVFKGLDFKEDPFILNCTAQTIVSKTARRQPLDLSAKSKPQGKEQDGDNEKPRNITFKFIPSVELFKDLMRKATTYKDLRELDVEWAKTEAEAKRTKKRGL